MLITTLAFFYTYLYNKTGSVLLVVLLHATITPANDTLILMPHGEVVSARHFSAS